MSDESPYNGFQSALHREQLAGTMWPLLGLLSIVSHAAEASSLAHAMSGSASQ